MCQDPSSPLALKQAIEDKLSCIPDTDPAAVKDTPSLTADWTLICDSLKEASAETIGFTNRKHQDWFDDNSQQIRDLLQAKNEAHAAKLRSPTSTTRHNNWKELRSKAQRELRQMGSKWWIKRAQEIQQYADANEVQNSIRRLKPFTGLCRT